MIFGCGLRPDGPIGAAIRAIYDEAEREWMLRESARLTVAHALMDDQKRRDECARQPVGAREDMQHLGQNG